MPWYAKKGSSGQATLKKSSKSPGTDWVEIPGATDSMTEQQAAQKLADDILHGDFGTQSPFSSGGPLQNVNPFAGFSSIEHALTAFYKALTNGKMWRSLGWLLLGLVLILFGASLWIKGSVSPASLAGL